MSSDYSYGFTNTRNGEKDLRMIFPHAQWDKWRNFVLIVDDVVDVWLPIDQPRVYKIDAFNGAVAENLFLKNINPEEMDPHLARCWNMISYVSDTVMTRINSIPASVKPEEVISHLELISVPQFINDFQRNFAISRTH